MLLNNKTSSMNFSDDERSWRYERKGIVNSNLVKNFISQLKTHPLQFEAAYADRVVNNIYFETYALDDFISHIEGTMCRKKVRVRWYGSNRKADAPVVEFKLKKGNVGSKLKFSMAPFDVNESLTKASLLSLFNKSVSPECYAICARHAPLLINAYKRSYYVNKNNTVRVTVDQDLRSAAFSPLGWHGRLRPLRGDLCVVEVKFARENCGEVGQLDGLFMNNLTKFSKYLRGAEDVFRRNSSF